MGLRDVAALAECIADAARLGLDPGAPEMLARYQSWRRADTVAMGFATDSLNRLFSNEFDRAQISARSRPRGWSIARRGLKSFSPARRRA